MVSFKPLDVRVGDDSPYECVIGAGGIGSGMFFELEGNHTLGREESRGARLRDFQDFGKGHIILHYFPAFLGRRFKVIPIGAVGNDELGAKLKRQMSRTGMDVSHVKVVPGCPTLFSACFLYPDGSGGNLTVSDSASSRVTPQDVQRTEPLFRKFKGRGMVLAAPEVPLSARERLLSLGTRYGFFRALAVTSGEARAGLRKGLFKKTDLAALNQHEARALAGRTAEKGTPLLLKAVARVLSAQNRGIKISVTFGSEGAYAYENGKWAFTPPFRVKPVNTAGAGDSHLAALMIGLAAGLPFVGPGKRAGEARVSRLVEDATDFAALLASAKVTSRDTIHLGLDAVVLKTHAGKVGAALPGRIGKLFKGI